MAPFTPPRPSRVRVAREGSSARRAQPVRLVRSARSARSARSVLVVPLGPGGPAGPQGPVGPAGPAGSPSSTNVKEFVYRADVNTATSTVVTLDGVKLLASCSSLGRVSLTAVATRDDAGILTERNGINFQIVPRFGTNNTTAAILLTPLSSASSRADVTVHYVSGNPTNQNTTINAAAVDLADGPNGQAAACIVFGSAITFP